MSRTKFLRATLDTGEQVVSEFANLAGSGQGYATQVFAGVKPFNAWRVVSGRHPVSGEEVLVRARTMYSGRRIQTIQQVKPIAGREQNHGYAADAFEAVLEVQHGQYGMWVAPSENTPEGAVAGTEYPIHRDSPDFRRYVILRVAGEPAAIGGEPVPELRHYIDTGSQVSVGASVPGFDDERAGEAPSSEPGDADEDYGSDED
jgi:hypothetical protein